MKLYIETYGCQMNVADSEVVVSVMKDHGYMRTEDIHEADVILVNTCSIRENAETRVWGRLDVFRLARKKNPELIIGVIGCMAERLKQKLIEESKIVDLVVGPDAYRELPSMLVEVEQGKKSINVKLSKEENYEDILPVRYDTNGVSAFVSIMRGCDNMCAFCVVPFTRGRERSRSPQTILREAQELVDSNYKEVTLLGQNVDKYAWKDKTGTLSFAGLLEKVAQTNPLLRVRFSTSYPHDMTDEVLEVMAKYDNICKSIHLPVQSGSTKMLELMKRGYTREWYMDRIRSIKKYLPECSISTDIITGFCDETEEDHKETLSLMEWVKYDFAFMFKYSERPDTFAARKYKDNIGEEIKTRRLSEIISLQNKLSAESKKQDVGKTYEVLIEGTSKKSKEFLFGRNSQNKVIVFPKESAVIGDYVKVKIMRSTSATLIGEIQDV
ncbi:MAG: tRNA (N6-isopentenyl adenosine(37)-C2)-methylthiotransferase MiaB [Bacteroidetes bacterium RIFOXYA12_FULL_35_11]|nr:MAG: tRNA (N6-isopentenyl adenosine(37)-C2)-methylthiotransferase MiaB [Bacteroidetes bacterium GWF2_35_48]OFY77749.1 MAG: tRNA (N6-isopentenyl adenosine(37)-C2)-methylthiotransferase MiaB [Bacteroidetes bacterium RIFOXYA12_FULL_35_11]OFY92623.1 MAG: tRNA (N6-isopentenyl adenosine(37)-C2)-methylthiotransferase MiaB [Bacteroidetes bacterium RIFOXYC12_FULL_35_7]OFY96584.1 MAG: tRNA (N6-isopentenyl adenosine(37)-C2)-methylthiotransferase MiaB [Bacteroidetes bacterium RIFOXYB2_FULL_35_7]